MNFWKELPKPIFCLAPMEEVTDVAFREMFARYSVNTTPAAVAATPPILGGEAPQGTQGAPRSSEASRGALLLGQEEYPATAGGGGSSLNNFVMFTEFINVDGILHPEGYERLKIDLEYTENQRPIVAQIWGTDPEKFLKAAELMVKLGFDGIDINMGCPQDKEIGIGACAALIRNPSLASEIIEATIKGAQRPINRHATHVEALPVSVKTRLGYSKADEMENWVSHLLKHNIAALTLHARTKQEKSKVPAQWGKVAEAVALRNKIQESRSKEERTLIIGNGDVKSREEGLERIKQTGCDGVMIARGAFGNPWLFNEKASLNVAEASGLHAGGQADGLHYISPKERLTVALEHARLFQEKLGAHKSFYIMRKHFKAYCSGFDGAAELRAKLLETKNLGEAEVLIESYLKLIEIGN